MSTTSNKELYIGVFMFVAAVCSIAISGWQYKTAEGDFESGGDSLCEGMPFKYARRKLSIDLLSCLLLARA